MLHQKRQDINFRIYVSACLVGRKTYCTNSTLCIGTNLTFPKHNQTLKSVRHHDHKPRAPPLGTQIPFRRYPTSTFCQELKSVEEASFASPQFRDQQTMDWLSQTPPANWGKILPLCHLCHLHLIVFKKSEWRFLKDPSPTIVYPCQ